MYELARQHVETWRKRLLIDPRWAIAVGRLSVGEEDGAMVWVPGRWEARVLLRDKIPVYDLEHVILHELLELLFHELTEGWATMISDHPAAGALDAHRVIAQNRLIESLSQLLLARDDHWAPPVRVADRVR